MLSCICQKKNVILQPIEYNPLIIILMKKIFTLFAAMVFASSMTMKAVEIYGVYDESAKELTLYYDDEMSTRGGDDNWSNIYREAQTVTLDKSMQDARPESTGGWFYEFSELNEIKHLDYLNTSEVTNMSQMFQRCYALTALNLSHFDTKKVTDMSNMFADCQSITALDLRSFNTEEVTTMYAMFFCCYKLASLDISTFTTDKVTNMASMFSCCQNLATIDVSRFNTANVTTIAFMFYSCDVLTELDLRSFDISNVETMGEMFRSCNQLAKIYCDSDWSSTTAYSSWMFNFCFALTGGKGTPFNDDFINAEYARPDEGPDSDQPGYFTRSSETGIESLQQSVVSCQKVLRDGALFIERGEKVYSITGQEVK